MHQCIKTAFGRPLSFQKDHSIYRPYPSAISAEEACLPITGESINPSINLPSFAFAALDPPFCSKSTKEAIKEKVSKGRIENKSDSWSPDVMTQCHRNQQAPAADSEAFIIGKNASCIDASQMCKSQKQPGRIDDVTLAKKKMFWNQRRQTPETQLSEANRLLRMRCCINDAKPDERKRKNNDVGAHLCIHFSSLSKGRRS
jgi:hypothetical protein